MQMFVPNQEVVSIKTQEQHRAETWFLTIKKETEEGFLKLSKSEPMKKRAKRNFIQLV